MGEQKTKRARPPVPNPAKRPDPTAASACTQGPWAAVGPRSCGRVRALLVLRGGARWGRSRSGHASPLPSHHVWSQYLPLEKGGRAFPADGRRKRTYRLRPVLAPTTGRARTIRQNRVHRKWRASLDVVRRHGAAAQKGQVAVTHGGSGAITTSDTRTIRRHWGSDALSTSGFVEIAGGGGKRARRAGVRRAGSASASRSVRVVAGWLSRKPRASRWTRQGCRAYSEGFTLYHAPPRGVDRRGGRPSVPDSRDAEANRLGAVGVVPRIGSKAAWDTNRSFRRAAPRVTLDVAAGRPVAIVTCMGHRAWTVRMRCGLD